MTIANQYLLKLDRGALDDLVRAWLIDTLACQCDQLRTMGLRRKWTLREMQECFETFEACNTLLEYLSVPGHYLPATVD